METDPRSRTRLVNFIVTVVFLVVIMGGLFVLIVMASRAGASAEDAAMRKILARFAWVSLVVLSFAILLLFWSVMRFYRARRPPRGERTHTPYVDAWSLAGKRLKLEDDEQDDWADSDEGG